MTWVVMWSGGPRSTAAVVAATMEGKKVIAYNVCALGQEGHLKEIEHAWHHLKDSIIPIYMEISDNVRLHGRCEDLVAFMSYTAHVVARDYTDGGYEGTIYGKAVDSLICDRLKVKGPVRYGIDDDDEIIESLNEIGLTWEDFS